MGAWAVDDWQFMALAATLPWRQAPVQILVVEDDLCLQPVLQATLRQIDPRICIDWRTSVDQVLEEIKQNLRALRAYDLIIADVFLPGTHGGIELWKACRFNCPSVRFIMMSTMNPAKFQALVSGQGTHPPFVSKPFAPQDMLGMIDKVLRS